MNVEDGNNFALVRKPASSVERTESGAKRVLATMVSDTLAMAPKLSSLNLTLPTKGEVESWYQQGINHAYGSAESIKWYRKAAEHGHAKAQWEFGDAYHYGAGGVAGVQKDANEMVKWYRMAADQGLLSAQIDLAITYLGLHARAWRHVRTSGLGITPDYTEAAKWLRMAADQGHPECTLRLGSCYEEGKGVGTDHVEAYKWFRLAEAEGREEATEKVVSVGLLLTPQERLEAERRIAEFKATHPT